MTFCLGCIDGSTRQGLWTLDYARKHIKHKSTDGPGLGSAFTQTVPKPPRVILMLYTVTITLRITRTKYRFPFWSTMKEASSKAPYSLYKHVHEYGGHEDLEFGT